MREKNLFPQIVLESVIYMKDIRYRILDLFSGAGGLSCGLNQVQGFATVVANDINKFALDTFKHNNINAECILGDITSEKVKSKIEKKCIELKVNMIVGEPPCKSFASTGKGLALSDNKNALLLDFIDMVRRLNPEIFLIENVKNIISATNGFFIDEIVKIFQLMGYNVEYCILDASDFGVPQNRERAVIIGCKDFSFDFENLIREEYKKISVREAISDLAFLESGEGNNLDVYKNFAESDYQKTLRNPEGILYNHMATNHSKNSLKKLSMIPPEGDKSSLPIELHGNQKFKTTWSRLEWDKQSPAIDTRFDTPSNGKNSHPYLNRAITPREAARLQSFPDSYYFCGSKTEVCKQIGNAVPPFFAKAIGKSIIRQVNFFDKKIETDRYTIFNGNADYVYNYLVQNNIKVDHIITDPPYSISKENNFSTMKTSKRKGIDFGIWDKNFDLTSWISKYSKLVKDNGSIIIFCSYRYISFIIEALEQNDFDVKDFIEWKKSNPMPRNINRRYVQDTEFAIWAVKKKAKWIFNKPKDVPYLRSSFTTSTVSGTERTPHPTQKSLELMRKLIRIHTNEDDVILDMFCGSGTTGVAALMENRKFIGIEISEEYFNITKNRIDLV